MRNIKNFNITKISITILLIIMILGCAIPKELESRNSFSMSVSILTLEEGFSKEAYCDVDGIAIGYGQRLTYGSCKLDEFKNLSIPELVAKAWMAANIKRITLDIKNSLELRKLWLKLNEPRRAVLICMVYQMGMEGLLEFKIALGHMNSGQFVLAAKEMLDSKWGVVQTKARANRMAEIMLLGTVDNPYAKR